jgi:hypothetical protein
LLALPFEERAKLAEALWESVAPADLERLVKEFRAAMAQSNLAVEAARWRLHRLDAELRQGRADVREAVLRSGDQWQFASPVER